MSQDLELNFLHSQTLAEAPSVIPGSGLPHKLREACATFFLGRLLVYL